MVCTNMKGTKVEKGGKNDQENKNGVKAPGDWGGKLTES